MSSLPPDIIPNILMRLPVKSLLRFRCVSKQWCSQIDGPDFIKLHLSHSMSTHSKLFPVADPNGCVPGATESKGTLYSLDSDSLKKLEKINTPLSNSSHRTLLLNTCNGLLLLQADDGNVFNSQRFILFNPSTRKHLVLPTPPYEKNFDDKDGCCCFGYDVVNDDYKVFNMVIVFDVLRRVTVVGARVFSLKSNSWRIIKDFAKGITFESYAFNRLLESYVSGALHSVTFGKPRTIAALDVSKESFTMLPMPNFVVKDVISITAHVFDGSLAVLCQYRDNRNDVWVMKEYGVKESWNLLMSLKPSSFCYLMVPVVYSKSRTEVLLSYNCEKLVWYDLKKKTFRDFAVSGLPVGFGPVVCIESLVSVGGHGKIGQKKKQGEEKTKEKVVKKKRDDFLSKGFKLKL